MPSAPILTRTLLWETLSDGTIHVLDWQLVQTSLGQMIEPRTLVRPIGDVKDEDLFESGFTDMRKVQSDAMWGLFNFAGSQWAHYRANDPGVL